MIEIYAITDLGRQREQNEDCFLVNDYVSFSGDRHINVEGDFIVAVADGVGGYNAGDVASRLALEELSAHYAASQYSLIENADKRGFSKEELDVIIQDIHHKILSYGKVHINAKGLGATLAGFSFRNGKITLFHIGDSRIYRFRDGILKCLTKDHSLVQVLYDSGKITRGEMFDHPQKHIILQYLGNAQEKMEMEVETIRGTFEQGDLFIICSDGLSDMMEDEVMEEILATSDGLPQIIKALVARAIENGGHDNITVIGMRQTI